MLDLKNKFWYSMNCLKKTRESSLKTEQNVNFE